MSAKKRMSQNKGPPPKLVKSSNLENAQVAQTASGLDQEAEDQFELELCWCIQQLETGLSDKNLQEKQIYNMSKSLSVLKSNSASLVKKRQVMRNTFGDYRAKMADEEKKFAKASSSVKFGAPTNKKLEKKSIFFKKANDRGVTTKSLDELFHEKLTVSSDTPSETGFKFNFPLVES